MSWLGCFRWRAARARHRFARRAHAAAAARGDRKRGQERRLPRTHLPWGKNGRRSWKNRLPTPTQTNPYPPPDLRFPESRRSGNDHGLIRDEEAVGSNPATPTPKQQARALIFPDQGPESFPGAAWEPLGSQTRKPVPRRKRPDSSRAGRSSTRREPPAHLGTRDRADRRCRCRPGPTDRHRQGTPAEHRRHRRTAGAILRGSLRTRLVERKGSARNSIQYPFEALREVGISKPTEDRARPAPEILAREPVAVRCPAGLMGPATAGAAAPGPLSG